MQNERELEILKDADHPFVIEYIEQFPYKENLLCVVTKLASGGNLENYMHDKKCSEDEAM